MLAGLGLLLAALGDALPKSRPGFLVGIRTPWALVHPENEHRWKIIAFGKDQRFAPESSTPKTPGEPSVGTLVAAGGALCAGVPGWLGRRVQRRLSPKRLPPRRGRSIPAVTDRPPPPPPVHRQKDVCARGL